MRKQTGYLIIGIGIASILAGVYGAIRTGEFIESVGSVFIGAALIGTVIIERNRKESEQIIRTTSNLVKPTKTN